MADALVGAFTNGSSGFRPQVQVLVPLAVLAGASEEPGLLFGYGPLDAPSCRRLAAAGELRRALLDPAGVVVAVDDQVRRPPRGAPTWPPPALAGALRAMASGPPPPGRQYGRAPALTEDVGKGLLRLGRRRVRPLAVPDDAEIGYRPSRRLRRLVALRDLTCRFPGCSCPATAADLDHVTPWSRGGRTSPTNLVALCVAHHGLKHSPGWGLALRLDGGVVWTTPTGLRVVSPPPRHRAAPVAPGGVREVPLPSLPAPFGRPRSAEREDAEVDAVLRALRGERAPSPGTELQDDEPLFAVGPGADERFRRHLAEALAWEAELRGGPDDGVTCLDDVEQRPGRLATGEDVWPASVAECTDWDVVAGTNRLLAHRMAVEEAARERVLSRLAAEVARAA